MKELRAAWIDGTMTASSLTEGGAVTLFSYCLRYDTGAAPNPFWGTCTLVICKPAIRRTAEIGDWIVGFGSAQSPIGNISGRVVYAMRVSRVLSMPEYDQFCKEHLSKKIPDPTSRDSKRLAGDCIYDFSRTPPRLRPGVHGEDQRDRDLRGNNALLSDHFYYFGDHPVELPRTLRPIAALTQGHKSSANDAYERRFVAWIESFGKTARCYGAPQMTLEALPPDRHGCIVRPTRLHPRAIRC